MRKNEIYEIEITGMTDEGNGVGRIENIAVFVPYTIVGERVLVNIIKVNKTYAIGKLTEVLKSSPNRIKAECPYFYKCGGCQLWHMNYQEELLYKHQKVTDCMQRIAKIDTPVSPVVANNDMYRYRNKVQMPVSDKGIGFYRKGSHDVIDMEDCLLQSESSAVLVKALKSWMHDYNIMPYNEETGQGYLRHIYTRDGDGGILFTVVTAKEENIRLDELSKYVKKTADENKIKIAGIIQNVNTRKTNTVLGKENIVIWGNDKTRDVLGGTEFEISPNSFYQVNKEQTVRLYNIAAKLAKINNDDVVWDLYCGIGTIGLFCAKKAKSIVGIECVSDAVENAKINAKINNMSNTNYYVGKAEDLTDVLKKEGGRPNVVFLDPPRKGCDQKLLDTVVSAGPDRIVYISCKPSTLARDINYLSKLNYNAKKIVPVDMFPRTCHVETVALLSRE